MNGYSGTISPPGMYVRALYDYQADDHTSLSFSQGDIIQVLNQLESGWWDGVMHGYRGWFPSNYCELITGQEAQQLDDGNESDADFEASSDDAREDLNNHQQNHHQNTMTQHASQINGTGGGGGGRGGGHGHGDQEEGAFWIPQATPDGRLFYFNTLTGVSTMELPLESPLPGESAAQRDRSNVAVSDSSRPPPEMMAGGFARAENSEVDGQSVSETDDRTLASTATSTTKRGSYMSDGASPSTSLESLNMPPNSNYKVKLGSADSGPLGLQSDGPGRNTKPLSKPNNYPQPGRYSNLAGTGQRKYLDSSRSASLTWSRLIQDMRSSVERYRQAINTRDRADYVRRAEDISDHLRLLLAAGSGTTDNHSGFPSIIATNKALYPHFRDMMSRFSKLVLSSHIAAADFAAPDSCAKCLQEAEGVLNGVYGFVEVARSQRGEEISRLFPGFVKDNQTGGSWQNNGLSNLGALSPTSFIDQDDYEPPVEPNVPLDTGMMERMNDLKRLIVSGLRRLEERLVIQDRIISIHKHRRLSSEICNQCSKVMDLYRPWITAMESVDLSGTGLNMQSAQFGEFSLQKQRVYISFAELIMACQAVSAPLADEWESNRGDTLEDRIDRVRAISRSLESATSKVNYTLQNFLNSLPTSPAPNPQRYDPGVRSSSLPGQQQPMSPGRKSMKSPPDSMGSPGTPESSDAAGLLSNAGNAKINKIFGEAPLVRETTHTSAKLEDMPEYLRLDFEAEVQYDTKTEPASIKAGTLTGLVEQLTRHDRYDAPFMLTFLLTYQSFTTAAELFEALIRRWSIHPPPGLSSQDVDVWVNKKQHPIRMRIVNVMKSWIDAYWMEANDSTGLDLVTRIYNFAKDTVASSGIPGWRLLLNVIEQRMRGEDNTSKKLVPTPNFQAPLPILPKNMKKLRFFDIDPTELARQLTIIESRLYGKIKPHECLNKIWQKKTQPTDQEPAANVKALILHSNRLTNWVAEMILQHAEPRKRVNVIKHFVAVAEKCRTLNNFSTLTSIISALGTAPIHRLSRTWSQVNKQTAAVLENMRKLMGSTKNFQQYREALHHSNPPCIPFFGVYLTDLTFIEDGISSTIKKTDLINFTKRAKTAEVIREIQTYQNVSYPFKAVPELQDYILSMMQGAGDVHEMYDKSLQVEPREREDEKIARLLSESGFL